LPGDPEHPLARPRAGNPDCRGALLIAIGFGIKVWAARSLGGEAYYWHNFFADDDPVWSEPVGPYRYLKNPMYTIGYAHAYGAALLLGSRPALLVAVFDQAAILLFHHWVEKPHFERLSRRIESD